MRLLRRLLILGHRYIGIPLSVLFVVWFASGIVMMYAGGMPRLEPEARLEHLPPLDLSEVRITPFDAVQRAGAGSRSSVTLLSVLDRPAYRFGRGAGTETLFADTGEALDTIDIDRSRAIAGRFLGIDAARVHYVATIVEPDQWTLTERRSLPLQKFRVDDESGTEIYVSPRLAEVRLTTTMRSRLLAWAGTIPHWLYFTPLRKNQPLWYWTVVGASGLGCVLAAAGLVLAVTQFRRTRPFRLSKSIPYRGWMRWHYLLGAVFGVFSLTWVFSGLLSMEPFAWTRAPGLAVPRDALNGGPLDLARFPSVVGEDAAAVWRNAESAWNDAIGGRVLKEIELTRIQDEPYYVARYAYLARDAAGSPREAAKRERLHQPYAVAAGAGAGTSVGTGTGIGARARSGTGIGIAERAGSTRVLVAAHTMQQRTEPFGTESLLARLRGALPDVAIVDHALLTEYDAYYYSRQHAAPLPVLRVKLGDPMETWLYIDPQMSRIVARVHRLNRIERWLYNGLHSLDFSFWYEKRPLWDIGMIVLSLGALAASSVGLIVGVKRVRRWIGRTARRTVRRAAAG